MYHECRSLAREYDVTLVCFDDGPQRDFEGVHIAPVGPRPTSRRQRWSQLATLVHAALLTEADLYHFHDPELIRVMRALRKQTNAPVVYDIHEYYPDAVTQRAWIPAPLRPALARIVGGFEVRNARHFDALVVADDALRDHFSAAHPLVARVRNYPPLDLFGSSTAMADSAPTMLYVGSISLVRGLSEMLETLRIVRGSLSQAKLILAGKPTEDAEPILRLAQEEFGNALEFLGPVPYHELAELLGRAHVGLSLLQPHPKYEKNVPTKVFDYMAASMPYVASSSRPLRDITREIGGRLVTAGDPVEAAQAALALLTDPAGARSLGAKGRAFAESEINWASEERELLGMYRKLLS